jgi:pimeloyl-ACP methyl ester carboxylesterase
MFVHVRDAAFHVRSYGAGDPPLVQTGALTLASEVWSVVTDRLASERRIVSVDQRGAGRTQSSTSEMTFESQAEDLVAILDHLGVTQCVHLTESTGAASALIAAARRPDLFAGLALVAPNWWHTRPSSTTSEPGVEPDVDEAIRWLSSTSFVDKDPVLVQWGIDLLTGDAAAFRDHSRLAGTVDFRELLLQVTAPTLVVHGTGDVIVPQERSERLVELLPDARLQVFEGMGHEVVSKADEIAAALRLFIRGLPG